MIKDLQTFKIETMTLKEITDLLDVRHNDAMLTVDIMVTDQDFGSVTEIPYRTSRGNTYITYQLSKLQSIAVAARLSTALLMKVIIRWNYLEEQLSILQFRKGDKQHQLNAMEALSYLLPEDMEAIPISYIKANSIVNKATSNHYGFTKSLKKDDMSVPMLHTREKVLDDYVDLYRILDGSKEVKTVLYNKYSYKQIEAIA